MMFLNVYLFNFAAVHNYFFHAEAIDEALMAYSMVKSYSGGNGSLLNELDLESSVPSIKSELPAINFIKGISNSGKPLLLVKVCTGSNKHPHT